jgi:hypothetical protein
VPQNAIGVGPHLTRAEIQQLKERAAGDLRSVASYVAWLVLPRTSPARLGGSPRPCAASRHATSG